MTNIDQIEPMQTLRQMVNDKVTYQSLKQTNLTLWQLERNANSRLILENLLLTYPHTI